MTRGLKRYVLFQYSLSGYGFATDKAILARGKISIDNNGVIDTDGSDINITADIASYCENGEGVTIDGQADVNGTIYVPSSSCPVSGGSVSNGVETNLEVEQLPIISFQFIDSRVANVLDQTTIPKVPSSLSDGSITLNNTTYNLTSSTGDEGGYYAPNFIATGTTTINVTGNVLLVVDYLKLDNNITIQGSGKLEIFVRERSDANSTLTPTISLAATNDSIIGGFYTGSTTNPYKEENFLVYVKNYKTLIKQGNKYVLNGTPIVTLSVGSVFHGSIMFDVVNIEINQNAGFDGYLLTNGSSISFLNNTALSTTGLYYAPNATVYLKNGADMVGSIVAQSVELTPNSSVIYKPMSAGDMPFILTDPTNTGTPYVGDGTVYNYTFDPITEID